MNAFISLASGLFGDIKQLTLRLSIYLLNLSYLSKGSILISAFSLKTLAKILELRCLLPKEIEHVDVGEGSWFGLPSGYLGNHTHGN